MSEHTSRAVHPGGPSEQHTDQIGDHRFTGRPASAGPLVFLFCLLLMLAGFWIMAISFDLENGLVFSGGLLLAGVAFLIPMVRAER